MRYTIHRKVLDMLEIAIIEDQEKWRKAIGQYFQDYAKEIKENFKITFFETGESFLLSYDNQFDLICMDIGLPGKSGIETSKELRKMNPDVCLIFLTELSQFAVEGYEVNAYDFLVKPMSYEFFKAKMDRILDHIRRNQKRFYSLKNAQEVRKIEISTISFIESDKHYLYYHCEEGTYRERGSLDDIYDFFHENDFVKINRSILVNLKKVDSYSGNDVKVGKDVLPLSRVYKPDFLKALNTYLGTES